MRAYTDETYYINDYLKGRKPVITAGFLFYARSASQVIDRCILQDAGAVVDSFCELYKINVKFYKESNAVFS